MMGVTIGHRHSFHDWGVILSSVTISPPEPQLALITIPTRDGLLDITEELTDDIKYKERFITMTFKMIDPRSTWSAKMSEITNHIHGKKMTIVFDDDLAFYYVGRVVVNEWDTNQSVGQFKVECTVDPYKYDILSTAKEWLWDTFDFENGFISEAADIPVDGRREIIILGKRKRTYPTITTTKEMEVSFEGVKHRLLAGENKIYSILLAEGENVLTFEGNGVVTVEYRGGSL